MKHARFTLPLLLLLNLLQACAQQPTANGVPMDVFHAWRTQHLHTQTPLAFTWLSPELKQLLSEAHNNNPTLRAQRHDVEQAAYLLASQKAALWPSISGLLRTGREGNDNGSQGQYQLQLDLNWELDYLGKLDAQVGERSLELRARLLDLQQQQVTLASQVLQQAFRLTTRQQQYLLTRARRDNQQENLRLIEGNFSLGLNNALDVYLARSDVQSLNSELLQRQSEVLEAQRQLEQSLGRYPQGQIRLDLNLLPPPLPQASLPSQLLTQRFDVQAAQARLALADMRALVAYRQRFPSLTLSTQTGLRSDALRNLVRGEAFLWSAFASVTQSLFDAGTLAQRQYAEQASAQAQAARYVALVQNAFLQVEQALAQTPLLTKQSQHLALASNNAQLAAQRAQENYQAGLVDYLTVLEAQRREFNAKAQLINAQNAQWQNYLALQLALGGHTLSVKRDPAHE